MLMEFFLKLKQGRDLRCDRPAGGRLPAVTESARYQA